jgi:hypothetical protein
MENRAAPFPYLNRSNTNEKQKVTEEGFLKIYTCIIPPNGMFKPKQINKRYKTQKGPKFECRSTTSPTTILTDSV